MCSGSDRIAFSISLFERSPANERSRSRPVSTMRSNVISTVLAVHAVAGRFLCAAVLLSSDEAPVPLDPRARGAASARETMLARAALEVESRWSTNPPGITDIAAGARPPLSVR
jgi:hypothetical protein